MIINDWIGEYIEVHRKLLDSLPIDKLETILNTLVEAHSLNRQVFVFGNGGSAANSSHFVTDLGKCASDVLSKRFRCFSLNECVGWITAVGNDDSYSDIFVRQLENYADPGDVVMAFSVSGSSPNLVKAFKWANDQDLHTIAFTGGKGGLLSEIAETALIIDTEHYGHAEDMHMMLAHIICYAIIENPDIEIKH